MLMSMTGYGRAENRIGELNVVFEIRSVNSRFLEFMMRLPRGYESLEDQVRTHLQSVLSRGRITVTMNLGNDQGSNGTPALDESLLNHYDAISKQAAVSLGLDAKGLPLHELLKFPDVIGSRTADYDQEWFNKKAMVLVFEATSQLQAMRRREGELMGASISEQLNHVSELSTQIEEADSGRLEIMAENLRKKISNSGVEGDYKIDSHRLEQEIVMWSDKLDITEELTRMHAHVQHFFEIMAGEEDAGKRLNFLLQEMNREANTIGSKANSTPIGHAVVELKNEIERIREQVQNIQ